jgi:hypothetical protein
VLGRGRQSEVGYIFDVQFNFRLLAAVSPGEEQTEQSLLRAGQGSQVLVEGHAYGITGLAGVVCKTDGLRHDGG